MAFDAFLKVDGIPGESTDDKHKDWIEVLSFNHGVSQPAGGSGGARRMFAAEPLAGSSFGGLGFVGLMSAARGSQRGERIPSVRFRRIRMGATA